MAAESDRELFEASRGGDAAAFAALVERYHALVCAVAYGATGNQVVAEDVAQDAFVAAWRARAELHDPGRFRGWICAIARHLALNTRRTRRFEALDDEQVARDEDDLHARVETAERDALVWLAIAAIPERYRVPLVLFYREDRSVAEVAAQLGITTANALQRLHRGRRYLKQGIEALVEETLAASKPKRSRVTAVIVAIGSDVELPPSAGAALEAARAGSRPASWTRTIMKVAMVMGAIAAGAVAVQWGCASWDSRDPESDGARELVRNAENDAGPGEDGATIRDRKAVENLDERRRARARAGENGAGLPKYRLTIIDDDQVAVNLDGGPSALTGSGKKPGDASAPPAVTLRTISGRVLDEGGAPVTGAVVIAGRVLAMRLEHSIVGRAGDETDARGRFELQMPADVPCAVVAVDSAGWSQIERVGKGRDVAQIELRAAAPVRVHGQGRRGTSPESGAIQAWDDPRTLAWSLPTDDDGRFDLLLPRGEMQLGFVPGDRFGIGEPLATRSLDAPAGEVVQWDPGVAIGTRLAVDVARPTTPTPPIIVWAYVLAGDDVPPDGATLMRRAKAEGAGARVLGHGGDDLDEVFEFGDLVPGRYTVCARAEAKPRETLAMTCATVALDGRDDVHELALKW
jgi:RNA polymerase sigma factor (sigma-70 family)